MVFDYPPSVRNSMRLNNLLLLNPSVAKVITSVITLFKMITFISLASLLILSDAVLDEVLCHAEEFTWEGTERELLTAIRRPRSLIT